MFQLSQRKSRIGKRASFRFGRVNRLVAIAAVLLSATSLAACSSGASGASQRTKSLDVLTFQAPSLGAFLPAVIEKKHFDRDHGLNLHFTYATPDNYNAEFSAGHYLVGDSAALLSEALRTQRGSHVTYLFNLFDYFGAVVTQNPNVKQLTDLKGRTLAAATGTTNYAMFEWFAKQAGLNLDTVKTMNETVPGLSTMAQTGRADATELWEPAYSTLVARNTKLRTLNLNFSAWKAQFGTGKIPYLGVAAQSSWAQKNPSEVQDLYATYKEAANWVLKNPGQAATVIAASIPNGDASVIKTLIENNSQRLQLDVEPASAVAEGIRYVFKAGQESGYLSKQPPASIIYRGLK